MRRARLNPVPAIMEVEPMASKPLEAPRKRAGEWGEASSLLSVIYPKLEA